MFSEKEDPSGRAGPKGNGDMKFLNVEAQEGSPQEVPSALGTL